MAGEMGGTDLVKIVSLLGAAVIAVPLFKRLGLGSVLGYLCAGLVIGPFGLSLFSDPQAIMHIAELGVVMFLFLIGLEMRPTHLWNMRSDIFGLGTLQILTCVLSLTLVGILYGYSVSVSFIAAAGFVMTSTAIVMQLLGERGDLSQPRGQKIVSILLFEDLLIVPLLALVALMAPAESIEHGNRWISFGVGLGAIAAVTVAGIWFLNPMFRILARSKAREVMTAAALLVVLGAALLMQLGGLSMAMGAFLAGVLLSESSFRHQIEADIEPFRGILLGLFFLSVGMSLDLLVVKENWMLVLSSVFALMFAKSFSIYWIARLNKSGHMEALDRAILMAQGGEFAFVLFGTALAVGVIDPTVNANLTAIVVLSMALTPILAIVMKPLTVSKFVSLDGVDEAKGLTGSVLVIGFGRFGQIVSQGVIAKGASVSIIEINPETIRNALDFGFKVYYGDGTRLDILRAAGAEYAKAIVVAVDNPRNINQIVTLIKSEFPQAELLVRAYDREHALDLIKLGADNYIRETFESAMILGRRTLLAIGVEENEADELIANLRDRDRERIQLEIAGGINAGKPMVIGNTISGH